MPQRIIVIGGGIVGLATALRIKERFAQAQVVVLEKESQVGQHQSKNNSGVLHAGIYYKPGSVKARLAVRGIRQMVRFCEENNLKYEICGKLVVATCESEVHRLNTLFEQGQQNGLRDLRMLGPQQIQEIEPYAAGLAAIHVPEEGIIDYPAVCAAMASRLDGRVVTDAKVERLKRSSTSWIAQTTAGDFEADLLVNCTGLHCDRVSKLAGVKREIKIVPFRGEYYKIRRDRQYLVRNLIYPVPDPAFPFLGVHFTRLIHGGVEAGPNAVLALKREGYQKTDFSPRDTIDSVFYPGLWAFLRKYPRMCYEELRRSFSRELFCASLQKLVPAIQPDDLQEGGAGVRAQALSSDGQLVQDFHIQTHANSIHVLNAPSPGATASLAIGEEIASQIKMN